MLYKIAMNMNQAIQKKSNSDIIQQAKILMQGSKIAEDEIIVLDLLDLSLINS